MNQGYSTGYSTEEELFDKTYGVGRIGDRMPDRTRIRKNFVVVATLRKYVRY